MLSTISETKMRTFRAMLALGWIALIISLFWDPITPQFTHPDNLQSPFRLTEKPVLIQGVEQIQQPYAMGPMIIWTLIIPLVPLFLMLFGHEAWRRLCPLSFLMQIPRYLSLQYQRKTFNRRTGKIERKLNLISPKSWLRKYHWYLQFGLLFLALNIRILFINSEPLALAAFFILVIIVALLIGTFWGGKTWCNYICPVSVVQKIYTGPGGLLESQAHLDKQPISQSMCRTSTKQGDRSICVGCTSHCPDIDLELSYWENIENPTHRFVYYGFFGLLLGYFSYYYLYAGNWDYYFSGLWTHEADAFSQLFNPGWFIVGQPINIPKIIAVPITLTVFVIAAFGLGRLLETIYKKIRDNLLKKPLPQAELLNHCFSFTAFISINTFYIFSGRGNLMLLPDPVVKLVDVLIVFISTVWFWRSIQRSSDLYRREAVVTSLRKQLKTLNFDFEKILEGRSLDDLKADEVYVLAKTLPGFTRERKLKVYQNILQEALNTGKTDSGNSLALLRDVRIEMGLSDDEHRQVLQQLGIENLEVMDPDKIMTQEKWIRTNNYSQVVNQVILKALDQGIPLEKFFDDEKINQQLEHARSLYQISEPEHQDIIAQLLGTNHLLLEKADTLLTTIKDIASQDYTLAHQTPPHHSQLFDILRRVLAQRRQAYGIHLFKIVSSLGESKEAMLIARNLYILLGDEVQELLNQPKEESASPVDWNNSFPSSLVKILSGSPIPDEFPNPNSLPLPEDFKLVWTPCSYVDVISTAPEAVELLQSLIDDVDPIFQALALTALAGLNIKIAQEQARQLQAQATTSHWLVQETVAALLGDIEKERTDHLETSALRLAIKLPGTQPVIKTFNKPVITLGKSSENDVIIYDPIIAPYQAVIRKTVDGVFFEAINRVNNMIINDSKLITETKVLEKNDEIRFYEPTDFGPSIAVDWENKTQRDYLRTEYRDTVTKLIWLTGVEIFSALKLSVLANIARSAEVRVYTQSHFLCQQGEPLTEAFVLQTGTAEAFITVEGKEVVIGEITPGQVIGELSVITGEAQSATVRITSELSSVLVIKGQFLTTLMTEEPTVARGILTKIAAYVQRAGSQLRNE